MSIQLKIRRKGLELETRLSKQYERHFRDSGRKLRGFFKKKHKKGEPKPEGPAVKKYTDEEHEKVATYLTEHYAKLWNLTDYRKRILQHEARHLHLVRGFLKGQAYAEIESCGTYHHPDFDYMLTLAQEYSEDTDNVLKDKLIAWWDDCLKWVTDWDEFRAKKREENKTVPKVATA